MTFPDNIRAIHNFYCINTNNLIECPIFAENAKTMKKTFIFTLCSLFSMTVNAQNFSDYFEDKTLRADYIFTGDAKKQEVYLDELSSLPQWAGRKHHLAELPLAGNGEITMKVVNFVFPRDKWDLIVPAGIPVITAIFSIGRSSIKNKVMQVRSTSFNWLNPRYMSMCSPTCLCSVW